MKKHKSIESDPIDILSQASYAILDKTTDAGKIKVDLVDGNDGADFNEKQAEEFAKLFPQIVTQFEDQNTGFDVTVFKAQNGELKIAFSASQSRLARVA